MYTFLSSGFFNGGITPSRLAYFRVPETGAQMPEKLKPESPQAKKKSPEAEGRAILENALRRINPDAELDRVKNFETLAAAQGFVDYYLDKVPPPEVKAALPWEFRRLRQFAEYEFALAQYEIDPKKQVPFDTLLKRNSSAVTSWGTVLSNLKSDAIRERGEQPEYLKKALEHFIDEYNRTITSVNRKINIARYVLKKENNIKITKLDPTKLHDSDTEDFEAVTKFMSDVIYQLPEGLMDYSDLYDKMAESDTRNSQRQNISLLREFIAAYNKKVDAVNGRVQKLGGWAKDNPGRLLKIPNKPKVIPAPKVAAAPKATPQTPQAQPQQAPGNAPKAAPAEAPQAAAPAQANAAAPGNAPKAAPSKAPEEKFIADFNATKTLLERKFGEQHGIGGKGLTMADLAKAVGAEKADLDKPEGKKAFVAKTVEFQKKIGAKPDGRFGFDTYSAAGKYVKEGLKDKVAANLPGDKADIMRALKIEGIEQVAPKQNDAVADATQETPPATMELYGKKIKEIRELTDALRYTMFIPNAENAENPNKGRYETMSTPLPKGTKIAVVDEDPKNGYQKSVINLGGQSLRIRLKTDELVANSTTIEKMEDRNAAYTSINQAVQNANAG